LTEWKRERGRSAPGVPSSSSSTGAASARNENPEDDQARVVNTYGLFLWRSAQRFFIISDRRLRPVAVIPPRLFFETEEVFTLPVLARRSAQRRFIACDKRFRPAAVIPPLRLVDFAEATERLSLPNEPFSRDAIARSIRSRSLLSSVTILERSISTLPPTRQ